MTEQNQHRPNGRAALFGPAAPPMDRPQSTGEGRQALFSAAPRRKGTVLVECSRCDARTPVPLASLGVRMIPSIWIPGRSFSRLMLCPACDQPSWCRVHWRTLLD